MIYEHESQDGNEGFEWEVDYSYEPEEEVARFGLCADIVPGDIIVNSVKDQDGNEILNRLRPELIKIIEKACWKEVKEDAKDFAY